MFVRERQFARPAGGRAKRPGRVTPLKERRAGLKAKRWAQVLIELREKVAAAHVDQLIYKDHTTSVMALVAVYGNESTWGGNIPTCQKEIKRLYDLKRKHPTDAYSGALIALWDSFKSTLDRLLTFVGPTTQTPGHIIGNAKWIAKLVKVDIDKMFKEVSKQKGFKEPKSWSGLNADGTPKAVKVKKSIKARKKKPA